MFKAISFQEALELNNPVFIDLRSPSEFSRGSIPGAINISLLDDQERDIIGLLTDRINKKPP